MNERERRKEGRTEGRDGQTKEEVNPARNHNAPCPRRKGFALPAGSARRRSAGGGGGKGRGGERG